MPFYTVIGTIQSRDESNQPYPVQWYGGRELAQAVAALVQCAVHNTADEDNTLPESVRYRTLSVAMTTTECLWEVNQYQPWARVPCSGLVTETTRDGQTGLLCDAHVAAWDGLHSYKQAVNSPLPVTSETV